MEFDDHQNVAHTQEFSPALLLRIEVIGMDS